MILPILEYPDPRLKKVALPVTVFGPETERLVRDMAETMYAAPGIGLAATQVDVHKRVIVIDISETRDQLRQNGRGESFELATDGLLAVCIQHEMDHLLGKVFVDYLSPLKRARLAGRLRKKRKLAG
jgi:peptide deformylase